MTTTSSDWPLTVTDTHHSAGKEGSAHRLRDESHARIQTEMLQLSGRISRRVALLEASLVGPAHGSEDLAALAWIQRSLEDVEATIVGLSEANRRRSAVFQGVASSSGGSLVL